MSTKKGKCWADALNRKAQHTLNTVVNTQLNLFRELDDFDIQLASHRKANVQLLALTLKPSLMEEIRVNQDSDPELQRIKGFNFNGLCRGILSDIVSDRDQSFQACFGKRFKEPLELD